MSEELRDRLRDIIAEFDDFKVLNNLVELVEAERRAAAEAMRERCKLQIRKYALSTDELQLIAMLDELPLDSDGGA